MCCKKKREKEEKEKEKGGKNWDLKVFYLSPRAGFIICTLVIFWILKVNCRFAAVVVTQAQAEKAKKNL